MNFDRVAPHYRWLEAIAFGKQLQRARLAFTDQIRSPRRVLVVGEGDGRFLGHFVRVHPEASIDCIEASAGMIARARKRLGSSKVRFIQEDVCRAALPSAHYDLLVTHFVLDCFPEAKLREVVVKLGRAATADAAWLLADFRAPLSGWEQRHARIWLRTMYAFFRLTSGLQNDRLVDPGPLLRAEGFVLNSQRLARFGLIKSDWWRRLPEGFGAPSAAGRAEATLRKS